MREITDFFINKGISEIALYLILALPLVSTLIGFARHFIGIRTIGIFTPVSITYAFYLLGLNGKYADRSDLLMGLRLGIIFCLLVFIVATIVHLITKKIRMHYLPKTGIIITSLTVFLLLTLFIGYKLNLLNSTPIDPIALILLIIASEQYITVFIKKNFSSSALLGFETILVSSISYSILCVPVLRNLLLSYPLLVLILIPLNFIVGKFTGLRLKEYFRFRDILNQDGTNNDSQK